MTTARPNNSRRLDPCVRVIVRRSYSQVEEFEAPSSVIVWAHEKFDAEARNQMGELGAMISYFERADIDAAVAELRAVWGDLPVQMNLPESKIHG